MKQLLLFILITSLITRQGFSQAISGQDPVAKILIHYYGIKDALVAGNSANVNAGALQFIKTLNSIDYKVISEGAINVLLKDATLISETADLQQQRTRFANLSDNLIAIARAVKLSTQPLYLVQCPTKKVSWLSSDKSVKNPYGTGKPDCGEVVETIQ
jgi:hypothetical protein